MDSREEGSFEILPHPADVGVEARGPDLEAALHQAVCGLAEILSGGAPVATTEEVEVDLVREDTAALLVALLEECLFLIEARGWIPGGARLRCTDPTSARGKLLGEPFQPERHGEGTPVKAVTWHKLSVDRSPGEVCLRVYLDI